MGSVVFYFNVHQPYRTKRFGMFELGSGGAYFDQPGEVGSLSYEVLDRVCRECYLPMNALLAEKIAESVKFKVSMSISGVVIEQLAAFRPEVLESFQALVKTGQVELLADTYFHSLAGVFWPDEFVRQVQKHLKVIEDFFGVKPTGFRNTELIYADELALMVEKMGFKVILAETVERLLDGELKQPVMKVKGAKQLKVLLKNYRLSDDLAFRFADKNWSEWPLRADKYFSWMRDVAEEKGMVNLFMDYETFGEHHKRDSGIFEFMDTLFDLISSEKKLELKTVGEAGKQATKAELSVPEFISWADKERDLSAWLGNPLQENAAKYYWQLGQKILESKKLELIYWWERLGSSDHLYYMSTKEAEDGSVHSYFSHKMSPYEAYNDFMMVLHDLEERVKDI